MTTITSVFESASGPKSSAYQKIGIERTTKTTSWFGRTFQSEEAISIVITDLRGVDRSLEFIPSTQVTNEIDGGLTAALMELLSASGVAAENVQDNELQAIVFEANEMLNDRAYGEWQTSFNAWTRPEWSVKSQVSRYQLFGVVLFFSIWAIIITRFLSARALRNQ